MTIGQAYIPLPLDALAAFNPWPRDREGTAKHDSIRTISPKHRPYPNRAGELQS